jgi:hypothetical protein
MSKSRTKGRPVAPQRKRKQKAAPVARWLPFLLGGVVLLAIGLIAGRVLSRPEARALGPRTRESLHGVSGISYDRGPTRHVFPDPADQGAGRIWLPALGEVDAPVVVVEFSDIACAHCRRFNLDSLPALLEDYVATGKVRYVDHFFGFPATVQQGVVMAQFCAAEQGRYFEFKHALFQSVEANALNLDRAARIAGIEMDEFVTCQEARRYGEALQEAVFLDNWGVNSTPTFFINGEAISGNLPGEIRAMIDAALAAQ